MSYNDITVDSNNSYNLLPADNVKADDRIGNALRNGNGGNTEIASDSSVEDKKTTRKNELLSLARGYKISLPLLENFISKATSKSVYELDENEYMDITQKLLPNILELLSNKKIDKTASTLIESKALQIKKMHEGGSSYAEISEFICEFQNMGIFEILKSYCKNKIGNAKSAKDVDPKTLAESLSEVLPLLKEKIKASGMTEGADENTINALIKHLLLQTKDEDILPIWEAFTKVADPKSVYSFTVNALDSFADTKKLLEFVGKLKPEALAIIGLKPKQIQTIQAIITNKIPADKLEDTINRAKEIITEIIAKDPQLIKVILKIQEANYDLEKANLTPEEQAVYKKYSPILDELIGTMTGLSASGNQEALNVIVDELSNLGIDGFFVSQIAQLLNNNPDLLKNIDAEKVLNSLNDATGGKYQDVLEQNAGKITNNDSTDRNTGYGYVNSKPENFIEQHVNKLELTKQQLVVEDEDKITVEPNKKAETTDYFNIAGLTKTQVIKSVESLNVAMAKGLIDIKFLAQNIDEACSRGVKKVWDFLDRNQQNRINHLTTWHNTELSGKAAVRYDMDDPEIDRLGLSFGLTQVLKKRHEQLHRNEDDKPLMT